MKTKMLADFEIFISVALMENFIFCAVLRVQVWSLVRDLKDLSLYQDG